jgi:hypothetical protein
MVIKGLSPLEYCFVLLIVAAAAGYGLIIEPATAGTPPISCRPCQSSSDVVLMIGLPSEDHGVKTLTRLWIEKHSLAAQRLYRERTGETIRILMRYPANIAEFRTEVQLLADTCTRIAMLGIMSHGNVGYLQIGSDGVSVHNIDEAFGHGLNCIMSPEASVEIGGCNVGRGCSGGDFMLAVANRLLLKGGRIVAPESYVFGNALFGITPQSILGDRELRVGVGAPQWTKGTDWDTGCPSGSWTANGSSTEH